MHSRDIVHLDIKPEDIVFASPDGDRIRLVDFGLAHKLLPGERYISEYGSPEFVSPEIVNKHPVSAASDMWSVGVMTFLLLSGRSPFVGETDRDTLFNIQSGVWHFDHYFDAISKEGKDFITKLLKMDPSNRMSADDALNHPWLTDKADRDYVKIESQRLKQYQSRRREKLMTAVVHKYARFKPIHDAMTHPQVCKLPKFYPSKKVENGQKLKFIAFCTGNIISTGSFRLRRVRQPFTVSIA